ncbi:MAG TPA: GNAT family protein [Gemmatimonadota bacterium]|nr:GNAT family protein [Gemmatimonadota bacterium]
MRLEPLVAEHHGELLEIALDPRIWEVGLNRVHDADSMREYIDAALDMQREGSGLPFLIREQASGRAVGSTRYGNIETAHRRIEIGWTWVAPTWQRTAVNTECKYLLLGHAFEDLGADRVEFKTDALNQASRRALLRIGAIEEGVLRHHLITSTGRVRDSVYFSILADEWPSVKAGLERMLGR